MPRAVDAVIAQTLGAIQVEVEIEHVHTCLLADRPGAHAVEGHEDVGVVAQCHQGGRPVHKHLAANAQAEVGFGNLALHVEEHLLQDRVVFLRAGLGAFIAPVQAAMGQFRVKTEVLAHVQVGAKERTEQILLLRVAARNQAGVGHGIAAHAQFVVERQIHIAGLAQRNELERIKRALSLEGSFRYDQSSAQRTCHMLPPCLAPQPCASSG